MTKPQKYVYTLDLHLIYRLSILPGAVRTERRNRRIVARFRSISDAQIVIIQRICRAVETGEEGRRRAAREIKAPDTIDYVALRFFAGIGRQRFTCSHFRSHFVSLPKYSTPDYEEGKLRRSVTLVGKGIRVPQGVHISERQKRNTHPRTKKAPPATTFSLRNHFPRWCHGQCWKKMDILP